MMLYEILVINIINKTRKKIFIINRLVINKIKYVIYKN
jgi:hypothetical protein